MKNTWAVIFHSALRFYSRDREKRKKYIQEIYRSHRGNAKIYNIMHGKSFSKRGRGYYESIRVHQGIKRGPERGQADDRDE